jgi:hypothetical protein
LNTHSDVPEKHPTWRYEPFQTKRTWRQVDPPILYEGKMRSRYQHNEIVEYVDVLTGEIVSAAAMRKRTETLPPIHFSERCLQRKTILDGLRPEPREFATFVLEFRNQRRGITPGISKLCAWYAAMTGKQASHVRRYIPKLFDAGVLEGESLVGAPFQFSGKQTSSADHKHEDVVAELRYQLNLQPRRARDNLAKAAA